MPESVHEPESEREAAPSAPDQARADAAAAPQGLAGWTPAAVLRIQQAAGNQAVNRMLQRSGKTATNNFHFQNLFPIGGVIPRNDVELMGAQLKMREVDLATLVADAKRDVENIRGYFGWVTGVYRRCYGHYELVLSQASAEAESTQKWVDFIFGVATGVTVGVLSEVTIAAKATELSVELLAEVGAEIAEGGIGQLIKPEVQKPTPEKDAAPEFKEIQALKNLDELNIQVLNLAVPGAGVYHDPIVQCERLIAELRVIEAGGDRRMSDDDIREAHLKLMKFSLQSLQVENTVTEAKAKFDALRANYSGKQAPGDARCEQDIWIPWLAHQNIDTFFAPTLFHEHIRRHLADIGLVGWDAPGGRLNVRVGTLIDKPFVQLEPRAPELLEKQNICRNLKSAAAGAATSLPTYWKEVFLM
jgi:hypothetical protein